MKLHRLTPQGRSLITAAFVSDPTASVETNATYASPVDGVTVDIDGLVADVRVACTTLGAGNPQLDGAVAETIHRALPIGRRLASDASLWAWLAAGPLAFFVQHRWGAKTPPKPMRFRGSLNENAVARLWWTWELFATPDPDRANQVLRGQYLIDRLVTNQVVRYPHVANALVDAMKSIPDNVRLNVIATHLKRRATSLALECMTPAELGALIAEMNAELPEGRSVV